ncbi:AAA family ATPase [Mangrovibacterium marinum]|uniref:Putative ATPase n=1 Tax=Mangrovibacterium marinum TaxID=1639118 RepID=A0A2T5C0L1_9BACT|nr:AAA family ATPase [Mangrovibacterium marinum]PTN08137.1 putative ATPase [Mangrovibacterium marinum]
MPKNIIVISGGPGFGKTSLINALANLGLTTGAEVAREIITDQLRTAGAILPWVDVVAFQEAVLERRVAFWESVGSEELAFCDRAIPDQLAFARFRGFQPSKQLREKAEAYRYYPEVLICRPWQAIYSRDEIRKESFSEACRLHDLVCEQYLELGYKLHELPAVSVEDRLAYIMDRFALLVKKSGR